MANEEHREILEQSVEIWNKWREENPDIRPDLAESDLENLYIEEVAAGITSPVGRTIFLSSKGYRADLTGINLRRTNLWGARLKFVNLTGADLSEVDLTRSNLRYANLSQANLTGAQLYEADLYLANLSGAKLHNTNLLRTILVGASLEGATLENCWIHGTSVWGVKLNEHTVQRDLVIFDPNNPDTPPVKVDDIEIAQFIYLILDNKKIRRVIDTVTAKVVLILGRFTPQRKVILDAIWEELRRFDFVPVMFDFEQSANRDFTETIMSLAVMSRFIIADITNPRSSPLELQATVPNFMIPFVPIIQQGEQPFAMFSDLYGRYDWVLPLLKYEDSSDLVATLEKAVIEPALEKHRELTIKKAKELPSRSTQDYISA